MHWYRIKPKLLTKEEKLWFRQMLDTGIKGITCRNRQVFLCYLKCETFAATSDYVGIASMTVRIHVAHVLRVFNRIAERSWATDGLACLPRDWLKTDA